MEKKKYIIYTKEKGKIETDNCDDFKDLTRHKVDGPAIQRFYDNGQLLRAQYYINGKRHREDGPAHQRFYANAQLYFESYWLNGKMHRLDGPAYQGFYDDGQIEDEEYYINGIYYSKSEYETELFKMKLALL